MRECGLKHYTLPFKACAVKSLPVRECGLKHLSYRNIPLLVPVTPRAGVWIETFFPVQPSHLHTVTPRAGVWIETHIFLNQSAILTVTPRAGVWIETRFSNTFCSGYKSHSPCGSVD